MDSPEPKPLRVYIAGPMTGIADYNKPAFNRAAAVLRAVGFHVENPAENAPPNDNPTWDDWMAIAIPQLQSCDAAVFLPGWHRSKGARKERRVADNAGMPALDFHYALGLLPWALQQPHFEPASQPA